MLAHDVPMSDLMNLSLHLYSFSGKNVLRVGCFVFCIEKDKLLHHAVYRNISGDTVYNTAPFQDE